MISNTLSFVAVVKAGSFSKAAANLGVSKAQLSRHVSQLEASLGIQLLYRTTRSLKLTESGQIFYLSCRDIEENYEAAIDQLKHEFKALNGTLRITAPISFGSEFLPKVINQFMEKYPNIKIVLSLSSVTENLVEKNFDISFRIAAKLPDSSLKMRVLMELNMALIAAPSYLENKSYPQKMEDLKQVDCISPISRSVGQTTFNWSYYQNNKIVNFYINPKIEVDSLRSLIQFVLLGAGVGRVPEIFIRKDLAEGRLIQLLPTLRQPPLYVYLLYPNRKNLPKKVEAFIEFIKDASFEN